MSQDLNGKSATLHGARLCSSCSSINFDEISTWDIARKDRNNGVELRPVGIESAVCDLCHFFRQMRQLRHEIDPRLLSETHRLYDLKVHATSRLLHIMGFDSSAAMIFTLIPQYKFLDRQDTTLLAEGESYGRLFALVGSDNFRVVGERVDFVRVKQWLSYCTTHHTEFCSKASVPDMSSFKVIDCLERMVLFWTAEFRSYVTLSYVWGDASPPQSLRGDTLPSILPRVVEDAIQVTLALGYRYLWVDRYCIPQDDAIAKHAQLQNMGVIFDQSDLTIISASGSGPDDGLPGVGKTLRTPIPSVTIGKHTFTPLLSQISRDVSKSTWSTRGWTYQEGLLCRRRLVFTETQAYFQCRSMHCQEGTDIPLDSLHTHDKQAFHDDLNRTALPEVFPRAGTTIWDFSRRVNEYSARTLSFQDDILNAFRGVLRTFEDREMCPVQNLCGIPLYPISAQELPNTSQLVCGLIWDLRHRVSKQDLRIASRRLGFPSWTWLGWRTPKGVPFDMHPYPSSELLSDDMGLICNKDTFQCLVTISIEFSDASVWAWERGKTFILQEYKNGAVVNFLRLTGWVFTLPVPDSCIKGNSHDDVSFGPYNIRKDYLARVCLSSKLLGYSVRGDDGGFMLTCLITSYFRTQYDAYMPVIVVAKHPGGHLWERIGVLILHCKPGCELWDPAREHPALGASVCSKQEIVLG